PGPPIRLRPMQPRSVCCCGREIPPSTASLRGIRGSSPETSRTHATTRADASTHDRPSARTCVGRTMEQLGEDRQLSSWAFGSGPHVSNLGHSLFLTCTFDTQAAGCEWKAVSGFGIVGTPVNQITRGRVLTSEGPPDGHGPPLVTSGEDGPRTKDN